MRSILYLILLIIIATTSLHAQRKKPQGRGAKKPAQHQLLWEISGNGLEKPSYLYGTMHVQDKRAFEFSDSVLVKFHGCTAFAAEMRLDSAVRQLFTELLGDTDHEEDDDEEDEEEVDSVVTTEMETTSDYADVETRDVEEAPLETTQFELSPNTSAAPVAPPDDAAEDGIHVAIPEDYADLDSVESSPPPVMSEDSPSFTQGVPDASFKDSEEGAYDSFTPDFRSRRSYDLDDNPLFSDLFTSRRAPRVTDKPVFLDAYLTGLAQREGKEVIGLETMDEQLEAAKSLRSTLYDTFDSSPRRRSLTGLDPDDLIVYYRAGDLDKMSILLTEILPPEAYSVMIVQRNFRMAERAERYIRNGPTFIAIGAGHLPGEQGVIQLLRDRGFTLRPVTATFTGLADSYSLPPRDSIWAGIASERGAFSAEMPMDPIKLSLIEDDRASYSMAGSTYTWPDLLSGIRFTISYGDYRGSKFRSDTAELRETYDRRVAKVLRTFGQPVSIVVDSMPGLEFLTKETDGSFRRTRLILRRNRLYTVWVEGARELMHSADAEQFFNSFRLDPLKDAVWRSDTLRWGECVVESPGRLKRSWGPRYSGGNEMSGYTYSNDLAGTGYFMDVTRLSKYTQKSADTLLRESIGYYWKPIATPTMVTRNGIEGLEYDVKREDAIWRVRTLIHGNRLYEFRVAAPAGMIDSPTVTRFLDSFHPLGEPAALDLDADKSGMILNDLLSSDTAVAASARRAAEVYPFTAEHLPRIYNILDRALPDDDSDERTIKATLYSRLGDLHDPAVVPFIRDHYDDLTRNVVAEYGALRTLIEIGSDDALAAMAGIMVRSSAAHPERSFSTILYQLDLRKSAKVVPAILPLLENSMNRGALYYLTSNLLDSGMIARDLILPYADTIINDCSRALRRIRGGTSEYYGDDANDDAGEDTEESYSDGEEDYSYGNLQSGGRLLGYLPYSPRIDNMLRAMMRSSSNSIVISGVDAYVRQNGTPSKSVVDKLAEDFWTRIELYAILNRAGKADLFPEEYLTQRIFAESMLRRYLSEDDSYPDSILFVAQRVITSGEHPGRIYLFKFRFDSGERWIAAISGTQPLDEEKVSINEDIVYTDYTSFDDRTIDEHFEVMMREGKDGGAESGVGSSESGVEE